MTWLWEEPLPILFFGVVLAAMLAAGLVRTGQRWLLYAVGAVVIVTAALLLVERMVVTPKEEIEATLDRVAADLERNDVPAVLEHISQEAPALRQEAERTLKSVKIREAKIKPNLEVTVYSSRTPPLAEATFNGVIVGGDRTGSVTNQRFARFFVVTFRRENGSWRVVRYEDHDPRKGI